MSTTNVVKEEPKPAPNDKVTEMPPTMPPPQMMPAYVVPAAAMQTVLDCVRKAPHIDADPVLGFLRSLEVVQVPVPPQPDQK